MRMFAWFFPAFLSVLASAAPAHAQDGDTAMRALYLVVILVLLLSSLVAGWQFRMGTAIRYGAIWVFLGFLVVVAYAFRSEATYVYQRIVGAVLPSSPIQESDGAISVRKAEDGHYHILAKVNGESLELLADTGASTVVIPKHMAADLGVDVDRLSFVTPFETANGRVYGAMFRLKVIEIGGIVRRDVPASVVPDLEKPLLGMSFFNTLSSFEVAGDTMTLRD
jgi:aspartyl protease family protein